MDPTGMPPEDDDEEEQLNDQTLTFSESPTVQYSGESDMVSLNTDAEGVEEIKRGQALMELVRLVGQRFGRYDIKRKIGRGGMGLVFEAEHVYLKRKSAIKLMLPEQTLKGEQEIRRFISEARSAALLRHPNIVTVHDLGEEQGKLYIEMECVEGRSVEQLLDEMKCISPAETLRIGIEVARALKAAHEAGVIHRDIKPGNILISKQGEVKVVDFGLAYMIRRDAEGPAEIAGSPCFMAPEQCKGLPADARTDIYALGVTTYTMLTGNVPFSGSTTQEIIMKQIYSDPPDPCEHCKRISPEFARIITKSMAKEPDERFQSASEMISALMKLLPDVAGTSTQLSAERNARRSVLDFVKTYALFAETMDAHKELGGLIGSAQFAPEAILMWEGEVGQQAFIIVEGRCEVSIERDGKKIVLAEVGPGTMLGELALITGEPRSATVKALDDVVAASLSSEGLMEILQRYPSVVLALLKELSYRLYNAQRTGRFSGDGPDHTDRPPVLPTG